MRLRGIFWKPGVNGLGISGFHLLPYRKRFDKAAREHDRCYDIGENSDDRFFFDVNFLRDCLLACENDLQAGFAVLYFVMVRLSGWAFFRYNKTQGMYSKMLLDTQTMNVMGTGTRGVTFVIFGGEIGAMLLDMRWGLMLLILLVVADFRYGWGESAKRYKKAKDQGNEILQDHYRWHTSRAVRRTLNKLADYIVIMLMCGAIGMAVFEPLGIEHTWGAWIGAVIACGCEIVSIFGHFFYLHGIHVETKSLKGFFKALAVAFAKRKDQDVGESLEEAFEKTDKEK